MVGSGFLFSGEKLFHQIFLQDQVGIFKFLIHQRWPIIWYDKVHIYKTKANMEILLKFFYYSEGLYINTSIVTTTWVNRSSNITFSLKCRRAVWQKSIDLKKSLWTGMPDTSVTGNHRSGDEEKMLLTLTASSSKNS